MKVVILAGGKGTRIREETHERPKPMIEIGERPLLWHILKNYAHFGHRDFVICTGYLGSVIRDYFLNFEQKTRDVTVRIGSGGGMEFHPGDDVQLDVTIADTGLNTMTGGRVKRAAKYLDDDDSFMVTYGDGLSDVDISQLLAFHKSHGKIGTITAVQPESRFGIIDIDGGSRVTRFIEKPKLDGWINSGFFVFQRKFLDYIAGDETNLEREPLERLAAHGELMCFQHPGFFFAMDTFREYQLLNEMWQRGEAPWKVWT